MKLTYSLIVKDLKKKCSDNIKIELDDDEV